MVNDYYYNYNTPASSIAKSSIWLIIALVLAIVGGIVAYFLFAKKENKGEYTGFVAWLHDFVNFKKFFVEDILKIMYLISTIYVTLASFNFIGSNFAAFFLILVLGNVGVRIGYEFVLMTLTLVTNTTSIDRKLTKLTANKDVVPAETKTTKKKKETAE